MSTGERSRALSDLARLGFSRLDQAEDALRELEQLTGWSRDDLARDAARIADPDGALDALVRVSRRSAEPVRRVLGDEASRRAVWALLGASTGFADFYLRHPGELDHLVGAGAALPSADELDAQLLDAVGATDGFAAEGSTLR